MKKSKQQHEQTNLRFLHLFSGCSNVVANDFTNGYRANIVIIPNRRTFFISETYLLLCKQNNKQFVKLQLVYTAQKPSSLQLSSSN